MFLRHAVNVESGGHETVASNCSHLQQGRQIKEARLPSLFQFALPGGSWVRRIGGAARDSPLRKMTFIPFFVQVEYFAMKSSVTRAVSSGSVPAAW